MGYRTYIGSMPKREYNKIKSFTKIELFNFYKESKELEDENDFYIGVYEYGKELHEFGKYTDFKPPAKSLKSFFKKKELKERYEEYDFYIVTPEFVAYIIDGYKERIAKYYNDMIMPFLVKQDEFYGLEDKSSFLESAKTIYAYPENKYEFDFTKITSDQQTALYNIIDHVRSFRTEWTHLTPYNLKNGENITGSWKYEYAIFELVRIYKSFDWKRNVMIYYGY